MSELTRYGLKWTANDAFVSVPMDDGYWTPWHIAADRISDLEAKLAAAEADAAAERDKVRVLREALEYAVKQVPEIGTVPGVKEALATTEPEDV